MTRLTEVAYAKLNLTLDVLARRDDGLHDLSSIMQTISVRDEIEIELGTGKPWSVECDNPEVPTDETNLALRAARLFFETFGPEPDGLTVRITKRIPMQAGMGGGSADAAAVLRALNAHRGYPLSVYALCELGAKLSSDVPFCVLGGTALVAGRGERLTKLPDAPEMFFVVCKPELSLSTAQQYAALDAARIAQRPDNTAMHAALQRGELVEIGKQLCNVFEQVTVPEHLELNYIKSILMTYGAYGALMTGSGSAVFGIFDAFEAAAVACTMLKDNYPQVFIAKNV